MTILKQVWVANALNEWDSHEDYEDFYPDTALGEGPTAVPGRRNFRRYRFTTPFRYELVAVPDERDVYRFEPLDAQAEPGRWVEVMQRMVYDRVNDLLVGSSTYSYGYGSSSETGSYVVTIGLNESGKPEYSFFLMPSGKAPFMIGHARV
jgi:hypothetical protein